MSNAKGQVLILGWAEDVARVAKKLPYSVCLLNEKSGQNEIPPTVKTAVYVFSRDTGSSSELLSLISYVHSGIVPQQEFVLSLDSVELKTQVFPVISNVPEITLESLCGLSS